MTIEKNLERIADALETIVARVALPVAEAPGKPATTRKPKAEVTTATTATEEVSAPAATATEAASVPASSPASTASEPIDPVKLREDLMKVVAKAGPQIVTELFAEQGATKWSEVPPSAYPAFAARIADLLAA